MACGLVLSENAMVSEVNFSESASGSSQVVGQFVSVSGSRGLSASAKRGGGAGGGGGGGGGGVGGGGYGRDSREQTLSVGRRLCQALSDALRLKAHHVEAGHRYFSLAVQHNFIQGRRTRNVVASCMYIVCRRERTSHLLLDFADALQTNLYVLGATLLKFIRTLHIALPIIDPSLYIHRFAAQLEIGNAQHSGGSAPPSSPAAAAAAASAAAASPSPSISDSSTSPSTSSPSFAVPVRASVHVVAMTALRLVARMKRDWLQVGRRPSGICGACLLIACRMHGYRRSQREVLDVVKVCDATLRRRMLEFVHTKSSEMTFSEFEAATEDQHRGGAGGGGGGVGGAAAPLLGLAHSSALPSHTQASGQGQGQGGAVRSVDVDDGANPPAFTLACLQEAAAARSARRRAEVLAQLEAKGIVEADIGRQWEEQVQQLLTSPSFQQLQDKQPILIHKDSALTHNTARSAPPHIKRIIQQHLDSPTPPRHRHHCSAASTSSPSTPSTPAALSTEVDPASSPPFVPLSGDEEGEQLLASLQAIGGVLVGPSTAALGSEESFILTFGPEVEPSTTALSLVGVPADALTGVIAPTALTAPTALSTPAPLPAPRASPSPSTSASLSPLLLDDLSDVKDSELDQYLLTEEEVAFKTATWEELHRPYIAQQQHKLQQQQHQHQQQLQQGAGMHVKQQLEVTQGSSSSSSALPPSFPLAFTEPSRRGGGGVVVTVGGGAGSSSSASAPLSAVVSKKEKLTQSQAFLSVTSALPHPPAASSKSVQGKQLQPPHPSSSSSSGSLSASLLSSPFSSASPSLSSQSAPRRVSGKINYDRLKGLLQQQREEAQQPTPHAQPAHSTPHTHSSSYATDSADVSGDGGGGGSRSRRSSSRAAEASMRGIDEGQREGAVDGGLVDVRKDEVEWRRSPKRRKLSGAVHASHSPSHALHSHAEARGGGVESDEEKRGEEVDDGIDDGRLQLRADEGADDVGGEGEEEDDVDEEEEEEEELEEQPMEEVDGGFDDGDD